MSAPKSLLSRRFNIPSIADDILKWDQSWEEALDRLPSEDIFLVLKETWKLDLQGPSALSDLPMRIRKQVLRSQELAAKLLRELDDRFFDPVWAMTKEDQLREHYCNGMREACARASLQEDARALCPEITLGMLLKKTDFMLFTRQFQDGVGLASAGNLALLHSDWWDAAVKNLNTPEGSLSEDIQFAFEHLTLQRNEFITGFILHSLVSIVRELNFMSPISNLLKSEGFFSSSAWVPINTSTTVLLPNNATPIRCTYCTGSAEELGRRLTFMRCARCKSQASVEVCYCSRPCQLADWKTHKPHCGKVKPPSPNTGDRLWRYRTFNFEGILANLKQKRKNVTATPKCSNPERPLSPGLQRQVALLKQDSDADYFFFDDRDRPIRFVMSEKPEDFMMREHFYRFQEECMFGAKMKGLEVIAEYMVTVMGGLRVPGLSVERMLRQLSEEYRVDVAKLVSWVPRSKVDKGYDLEKTFLEEMSISIAKKWLRPR